MAYFRNIVQAVRTVSAGLRVTLPYHFARTVVVQYPDVAPTVQARWRGFHTYQIERCIACEACAKACPAACIRVGRTGPRKIDKKREVAVGGAMTQYTIDYRTCLFCGLCGEVCPTQCLKMGAIHDDSCYRKEELVVDFLALAKQGRRTIRPIWMDKPNLPAWAARLKNEDLGEDVERDRRQWMENADNPQFCAELAKQAAPKEGTA
jgi:NADH-quinone oxidoreductase subunit I